MVLISADIFGVYDGSLVVQSLSYQQIIHNTEMRTGENLSGILMAVWCKKVLLRCISLCPY